MDELILTCKSVLVDENFAGVEDVTVVLGEASVVN